MTGGPRERDGAPECDGRRDGAERTVWQSCSVNCGSRCPLQLHVRDGHVLWVEGDTLPETEGAPQMRACARGRSMRFWLDAPDRLDYPLRRVGARGEGRFERIGWDEALDEVASQIRRVVETYGNEAVLLPYATGLYPIEGSPFERLMNCYGGHLGIHGDYSCVQLQEAIRYTYGDDGYYTGSVIGEVENADVVVLFGNGPADTRMGGAAPGWEFERAWERAGFKVISIDPRHTETMAGHPFDWVPIRPGTDAALVAGIAWVLITEGLVDQEFLDAYCIGYDASTLPPSAPPNASYKDYILGTGDDATPKTPAWACAITGVPERRIVALAREMAQAKALFVAQGWGPQRHEAGELSARAIPMLAILTGNVGLPGTNSGVRERFLPFVVPEDPVGENPVKASIPAFLWADAVADGRALTALNAGVRGVERLSTSVKLIINHAGNCLTNQHADINRTHDILVDERLCEFIVACDVQMTDSVRYADIVLPDVARAEQANLVSSGNADIVRALVRGGDWDPHAGERRPAWDVAADVADRLGVGERFRAAGADARSVDRWRFERARVDDDDAPPSFDELGARGLWRAPYQGPRVAYEKFRADPEAHPLSTPSGKIEIYSERLADLARHLDLGPGQVVHPLPVYAPETEGWESPARERFPFQLIGYHCRQRTHSTYGNVEELAAVSPHEMQMNPLDAQRLGVVAGERVVVENDRGALVVAVRVTPRIMPGVLAIPQGAWHRADMKGDRLDWGGCINTLTAARPTALAKGNPQHTNLVRVRPLAAWLAERGERGGRVGERGAGDASEGADGARGSRDGEGACDAWGGDGARGAGDGAQGEAAKGGALHG